MASSSSSPAASAPPQSPPSPSPSSAPLTIGAASDPPAQQPNPSSAALSSASTTASPRDGGAAFTIGAACDQPNPSSAALYSVRGELAAATVVLTGATGYVGSLVLEQLLRTTDVARVYALARGLRGQPPQERVRALLAGPLFHLLRGRPALLEKVVAVDADMDAPGMGLSETDRQTLTREAEVIVHCAADIRLEVDVQTTLRANYEGTRKVLDLAQAAYANGKGRLRAHVHVSSAFVNMNRPRGSAVSERIYLMRHGAAARGEAGAGAAAEAAASEAATTGAGNGAGAGADADADAAPTSADGPIHDAVDCEALVAELAALEPAAAEARAEVLCARWDFANNYALGKHLAEQLVARRYRRGGSLPPRGTVIVRPSLVAAVAQAPHPGYCGNFAGPIGGVAAMVTGLYGPLDGIASRPLGVWDIVPGDVVASVILAAAAAASAGAAGTIARAAQAAREGRCDSVAEALASAAAAAGCGGGSSLGLGSGGSPVSSSALPSPAVGAPGSFSSSSFSRRSLAAKLLAAATNGGGGGAADGDCSLPDSPGRAEDSNNNNKNNINNNNNNNNDDQQQQQQQTAPVVRSSLARLYSTTSLPPLGNGVSGAATRNNSCADLGAHLRAGSAAATLSRAASAGNAANPGASPVNNNSSSTNNNNQNNNKLLIVHACTSSTYPVTLMESWNTAAEFITAHPPPFSLRGRKSVIPRMAPSFEPSLERVRRADKSTGAKVGALCALLRLFGDRKGAAKLSAGFASIVVQNNGRTDRSLTFEAHGLLALEAALCADERPQRMMVWRPGPAPADVLALSASYRDAAAADDAGADSRQQQQQQQQQQQRPAPAPVVAPADLPPVSWRAFLLTQSAGVYGAMFRRAVPRELDAGAELRRRQRQAWWRRPLGVAGAPESWSAKRVASGKPVVDGAWGAAASMGVVRHDFVLVKPLKSVRC